MNLFLFVVTLVEIGIIIDVSAVLIFLYRRTK